MGRHGDLSHVNGSTHGEASTASVIALVHEPEGMDERERLPAVIAEVLRWGGHYTYRVWFSANSTQQSRAEVVANVMAHGAQVEWSSEHLLAVDAADAETAQAVVDMLSTHEEFERLTWEAGQ